MLKTSGTKSIHFYNTGFAIMMGLSLFIITSCGQGDKKGSTGNTNTISADSATNNLEKKANAITGKWETTTALDDKIMFEFGPSKKEGDTYTGTYTFYVNDTKDAPAKYMVSADSMIRFFTYGGQEYPLIKVSVSGDGNTLTYLDQKDGESKLTRVAASAKQDGAVENREDCTVKNDNARFFVSATEKYINLKKGTSLSAVDAPMHQGIIVVKAKVGNEWVPGEILLDDTSCN